MSMQRMHAEGERRSTRIGELGRGIEPRRSRRPRPRRGAAWLRALGALLACGSSAHAQSVVSVSPDVTIGIGVAGGVMTRDHAVAVDNGAGLVVLENLGALPEAADVIGYSETTTNAKLLTFDTMVSLAGGVIARPGDVVSWNGAAYSIAFDAEAAGLPRGLEVDAVSVGYAGGLLLSFATDASLPGDLHVADEDLVRWNGSAFSLALDGSAAGMGRALDVDAVHDLGPTTFLLSFETGGSVGGVTFADEDVLRHANGAWSLERDLSTADADWGVADLDAVSVVVPEPGVASAVGVGSLVLALARSLGGATSRARRRDRSRRAKARRAVVSATSLAAVAALSLIALLSTFALTAAAQDGVREIDQSCAVTGGCFTGDAAGFPVTITAAGSYRLTTNLTLSDASLDAIVVNTSNVHIDLGGFAIVGPVVCSGTILSCAPAGTGSGIEGGSTREDIRVENGSISGMGLGVSFSGANVQVSRLRVGSNALSGISVGAGGSVTECAVFRNGGRGISVGRGSLVADNAVSRNASDGIFLFGSAALGGLVAAGNTAYQNDGSGLVGYLGSSVFTRNVAYDNAVHGISTNGGAQISGNVVTFNDDNGLDLGLSDSGYAENTMSGNGTDVVGGLNLGHNACNGTPTCP